LTTPTPKEILGIPWFENWYPGQEKVYEDIKTWYSSKKRFLGLAAPTGTGKTLAALLTAHYAGTRTVIVTDTKGLQSQYTTDTCLMDGVNVIGRNNFRCLLLPMLKADDGPCRAGTTCDVKKICPYQTQLDNAVKSNLVITNYAYWLHQRNQGTGLGEVGLVIFDEAHKAFDAVEGFLTIHLARLDLQPLGIKFPTTVDHWKEWQRWAIRYLPDVEQFASGIELDAQEYRDKGQYAPGHVVSALRSAKSLKGHFTELATVDEDWVIEETKYGYKFTPKWVANHAEKLFGEVPKVMLMSAILSQKTCDYLGVDADRTWIDAPSYFPAENTPIWHIPTIWLNHKTDAAGYDVWAARIDQIIQRRLDRKGIVFPVSYARAKIIRHLSAFWEIMHFHDKGSTEQVVAEFKAATAPAVLVSPTVTTGWNFEDDSCRYIVIGKMPFPDISNKVIIARVAEDKDWAAYLTMGVFQQECGRGSRSFEDVCEVLVIDDVFTSYWRRYKHLAAKWFQERVKGSLKNVPEVLV